MFSDGCMLFVTSIPTCVPFPSNFSGTSRIHPHWIKKDLLLKKSENWGLVIDYLPCTDKKAVNCHNCPLQGILESLPWEVASQSTRYGIVKNPTDKRIHAHTNIDHLTRKELIGEARLSKNRTRVKLLKLIHEQLAEETAAEAMDTAYGYDPINDASFTGEFEAIGA